MKLELFSRHLTRLGICLESSLKINSRKLSNLPRTCTMLKEVMMVTIDLSSRMFVLMLYCSAKNIELLFCFFFVSDYLEKKEESIDKNGKII